MQGLVEPASGLVPEQVKTFEYTQTPIQKQEEGNLKQEPIIAPESSIPESAPVTSSEVKEITKEVIKEVPVYRPTLEMMRALQKKSLVAIQQRKRKKIEKIMVLFAKKDKITAPEVQRLLIISRITATRYLDILEKEGRVRQVGKRGSHVYYVRI